MTAVVLLDSVLGTEAGGPIKNEPFTAVVGRAEVGDSGSRPVAENSVWFRPFVESGGGVCLVDLGADVLSVGKTPPLAAGEVDKSPVSDALLNVRW